MTIKTLKDLDFAGKLNMSEPLTEAAAECLKRYRGYLYINDASCALVNNFLQEASAFTYDKGMSKILESVQKYINDNIISWKLATACESIQNNNSTYSYIAKIGVDKVEKLLEMNENDVVAYIKAGALKGVKFIPEFRQICKDVYKTQISENLATIHYEMHTPISYVVVNENGENIINILGKVYAINEDHANETVCNDETFNKINAHLANCTVCNESIQYKWQNFTFSINEEKVSIKNNDKLLNEFDNSSDFMLYTEALSKTIIGNARQFMSIANAISEIYEARESIVAIDNARVFKCDNGSVAYVIECKENVISNANGNTTNGKFIMEALENIENNCGVDVKVVYEDRINEDMKKENPDKYEKIQEELTAQKRYAKIAELSESLKDDPAAIAVLNTLAKELKALEEE